MAAIGVALARPAAPPAMPAPATVSAPALTVYAPSTIANSPDETERVEFEQFAYRFIEAWIQPGPPAAREQALRPFMTPTGLAAQLARPQDMLPTGRPVGAPKISNPTATGGLFMTGMSRGSPLTLLMVRESPHVWKVDQIEAGIR